MAKKKTAKIALHSNGKFEGRKRVSSGKFADKYRWYVSYPGEKGRRFKPFESKPEAEVYANERREELLNHGQGVIHDDERAVVIEFRDKLEELGLNLRHVVRKAIERAERTALSLADLRDGYLETLERAKGGERNHASAKSITRMFVEAIGADVEIHAIDRSDVEAWLRELETERNLKPLSLRNSHSYASRMFNFARKRGYLSGNPCDHALNYTAEEGEPRIFPVTKIASLFSSANEELQLYLALGLFAGLRPEQELRNLNWEDVLLDHEDGPVIHIRSEKAKKRRRRYVPIAPNLSEWIEAHRQLSGPIFPSPGRIRRLLRQAREKVDLWGDDAKGQSRWPSDVMRHCFASYHLLEHGDENATVSAMGHKGSEMLHTHYRGLSTKAEAKRFWALAPSPIDDAEKVMGMA